MHPSESNLALFAGGELNLWTRLKVERHVRGCERCLRQVDEFRTIREWVAAEDSMPAGVNWDRLSREMTGNIRVGLAAGKCVEPHFARQPALVVRWRMAAVVIPVLILVLAGWLVESWRPHLAGQAEVAEIQPAPQGLVLAATSSGVEVQQDGAAFTLLHPRAVEVSSFVSGDTILTRYVDAETGYVTIGHVYAE